jgi:gliding motility-associated lipoprotein GldH
MRIAMLFFFCATLFVACDDSRLYEKNLDFENQAWMSGHKPEFEFNIEDTTTAYNLYFNLRNSVSYPYSRVFFTWYLQDSIGMVLQKDLVSHMLFDPKTGEPQGTSGLGDIYDHRVAIMSNHRFANTGVHKLKFEQFMRKDTLEGIFAVGLRVERAEN